MIITLGYRQWEACRAVATERHLELLEIHHRRVGPNMHETALPAAGWRSLAASLQERAFNRRGEWSSKRPGYGSALRRVSADLLALENHPGFGGGLVVGVDHFPTLVGFDAGPGVSASPYPTRDFRNMLLLFEPHEQRVKVDMGAGPVTVAGYIWKGRLPTLIDAQRFPFLDVADHLGWSPVPVAP